MATNTAHSKRIVKNSAFLYIRMLLLMGIGFYTVRVILEALGVEDLGIYNVVGSLVAIFDFVSSGLTNSTQRYINIGLGKNDIQLTKQYFSQSLTIHFILALSIILLSETIGLWFVYNKLVIPSNRFNAAVIIFHFSVITLFLRLIKVCFESDIIAREKMSIYAYLSVFEGTAKLLICYAVINNQTYDKLIFYGFLLLMINVSITLINILYCLSKYPETHFKWYNDKKVYKQLFSFVGINSFGVISWAIGKQGLNIVLNMFCGPVVNGAKGIASNLDRVVSQFGSNIDLAVRPQITKLYAQEEISQMVVLAMKSTKYMFFVEMLVSIPFLFQTTNILSIWLKEVPPYTAMFVRFMIIESLCNILGSGFNTMILASGRIKSIQLYGRLITLSVLPLSYIILKITPSPIWPMLISVILTLTYSFFLVYTANRYIYFGFNKYLNIMIKPIGKVLIITYLGCWIINNFLSIRSTPLVECIIYTFILCCYSIIIILYGGIEINDRKRIINIVKNKIEKCYKNR